VRSLFPFHPTRATRLRRIALVVITLCLLPSAQALTVLETWNFDDVSGRTLNLAANSATGRTTSAAARWDVAIPGLTTTGTGALRVRDAADGGPGRRTSFVNFASTTTSGAISLRLRLDAWNLAPAPGSTPPRLEISFIQDNALVAAEIVLEATASGLRYGWRREGTTPKWDSTPLASASSVATELRLTVDLASRLLVLTRAITGQADEVAGIASLPAAVTNLRSLRWACRGDFTAGGDTTTRYLDIGLLQVESGTAAGFPGFEPGPAAQPALLLAALGQERTDIVTADAFPRLTATSATTYDFRFFRARDDLDYVIETSPDLAVWTAINTNPGTPDAWVTVPLTAPATGDGHRLFARLRISVPAP
jgi:hypothetical protein